VTSTFFVGSSDAGQMTVAACVAAVIVDESDAPVVFAWRRRSRGCAGTTSTRPWCAGAGPTGRCGGVERRRRRAEDAG